RTRTKIKAQKSGTSLRKEFLGSLATLHLDPLLENKVCVEAIHARYFNGSPIATVMQAFKRRILDQCDPATTLRFDGVLYRLPTLLGTFLQIHPSPQILVSRVVAQRIKFK